MGKKINVFHNSYSSSGAAASAAANGFTVTCGIFMILITSSNGLFQERSSFSCSQMTQKCDLICFSNVRALSHVSAAASLFFIKCFLFFFLQRLQESSCPLNTKPVPSCPAELSRQPLCWCVTGGDGAESALRWKLMALAAGLFPRGFFSFCLC